MTYQAGSNVIVAIKAQSGLGTPASGSSGVGLRVRKGSPGMKLNKAIIESQTLRGDGMSRRGRHGVRTVSGSYILEAAVGELDTVIQGATRGTWTAAATRTYDNSAGLTSIQVTQTNELTQVGTTTLLGAVYVGDFIKLANMSNSANDNIWAQVTNVTATVITVARTPFVTQVADTACVMTIARKIIQGTTERYFTIDEYNVDLDISRRFVDCKITKLDLSAQPGEPVLCTVSFLGLDGDLQATGSSPILTSPTFVTSPSLVMADGKIRVEGTDYADLGGFNLSLDLGGSAPDVLGPNAPDVFLNAPKLTGSLQAMRTGSTFNGYFDNETQLDLSLHMIEYGDSDPKDFLGLSLTNATFDSEDPSPIGDGPFMDTYGWSAGKDIAGNPYDATMLKFATSAA